MNTSPKDIFLQLFATAMLYLSIIGTFIATFGLTDWYIKSTIFGVYPTNVEQLGDMLSFPLAMLTVSFPLYVWGTYMLYKRMKQNTVLQDSRARAWLTNLTLFLAAIIIAITAIIVVHTFFNGDLTMRTLVKSAAVLLVSILTILWYKGGEDKSSVDLTQKVVAGVGVAFFLVILIMGVVTMGSPKERRMIREDRELRYALQNAYYNIESSLYASPEEVILPETITVAPGTTIDQSADFSYERINDTTATMCARFQTTYSESSEPYYSKPMPTIIGGETGPKRSISMPDWSHVPGQNCYTIEVK